MLSYPTILFLQATTGSFPLSYIGRSEFFGTWTTQSEVVGAVDSLSANTVVRYMGVFLYQCPCTLHKYIGHIDAQSMEARHSGRCLVL